jgi:hypothetical protein
MYHRIQLNSSPSKARLTAVLIAVAIVLNVVVTSAAVPQKKGRWKPKPQLASELSKLRDDFVKATKEYKTNLEKLLAIYESNVKKAEDKLAVEKKLYDEGLIAKNQIDEHELAVTAEKDKVAETRRQIGSADTQIADTLVEAKAEEQMARAPRMAKGAFLSTTSFIRYNGGAAWGLNDAWKVQRFFSETFKKPLPIAVFGQGAIHDRWHLDHRNAMDVSLNPDGLEGQSLMGFLRANGIPFSAFREAIPGTATGPHIHIGRPSHRY